MSVLTFLLVFVGCILVGVGVGEQLHSFPAGLGTFGALCYISGIFFERRMK